MLIQARCVGCCPAEGHPDLPAKNRVRTYIDGTGVQAYTVKYDGIEKFNFFNALIYFHYGSFQRLVKALTETEGRKRLKASLAAQRKEQEQPEP